MIEDSSPIIKKRQAGRARRGPCLLVFCYYEDYRFQVLCFCVKRHLISYRKNPLYIVSDEAHLPALGKISHGRAYHSAQNRVAGKIFRGRRGDIPIKPDSLVVPGRGPASRLSVRRSFSTGYWSPDIHHAKT